MKTFSVNIEDCMTLCFGMALILRRIVLNRTGKKSGLFSVKSTYKYLCRQDYGPNFIRSGKRNSH